MDTGQEDQKGFGKKIDAADLTIRNISTRIRYILAEHILKRIPPELTKHHGHGIVPRTEEILHALRSLKKKKVTGPDGIAAELL